MSCKALGEIVWRIWRAPCKLWRFEHQMLTRCLLQLGPELQNSRCNLHLVPTTTWSTDVYGRDCIDNYATYRQYFPMRHQKPAMHVAEICIIRQRNVHHQIGDQHFCFWGQFLSLGDKNKSSVNSFKGFLLKKCAKISRFWGICVFFCHMGPTSTTNEFFWKKFPHFAKYFFKCQKTTRFLP
jgi:hypothetical protein